MSGEPAGLAPKSVTRRLCPHGPFGAEEDGENRCVDSPGLWAGRAAAQVGQVGLADGRAAGARASRGGRAPQLASRAPSHHPLERGAATATAPAVLRVSRRPGAGAVGGQLAPPPTQAQLLLETWCLAFLRSQPPPGIKVDGETITKNKSKALQPPPQEGQ